MKSNHAFLATVAAVLAVAVFAVPAAEALTRKPTAHRPAATSSRAELIATRATLVRATSELARIGHGIGGGTLRRQVSQLQRTLNVAKAQLAKAQARLDTPSSQGAAGQGAGPARHSVAARRGYRAGSA